MAWLAAGKGSVFISVWLQPGASKNEIVGPYGEALKIKITAPPIDGRANDELLVFLAERLGLCMADVKIKSGKNNRRKVIEVRSLSIAQVETKLSIS